MAVKRLRAYVVRNPGTTGLGIATIGFALTSLGTLAPARLLIPGAVSPGMAGRVMSWKWVRKSLDWSQVAIRKFPLVRIILGLIFLTTLLPIVVALQVATDATTIRTVCAAVLLNYGSVVGTYALMKIYYSWYPKYAGLPPEQEAAVVATTASMFPVIVAFIFARWWRGFYDLLFGAASFNRVSAAFTVTHLLVWAVIALRWSGEQRPPTMQRRRDEYSLASSMVTVVVSASLALFVRLLYPDWVAMTRFVDSTEFFGDSVKC